MATATATKTKHKIPRTAVKRSDDYIVVESSESLGYNQPQIMGRKLWLPMFVMALMAWGVGFILSVIEAGTDRVGDDAELADLQTLSQLVPAFMFIGFLSIFASITFAVARILGVFRMGGGEVQEISGSAVQTLKMPPTAKAMLGFMMMGMMVLLAGIIGSFIAAGFDTSPGDVIDTAQWGAASGGLRRMGVALYLTGIAFGLGTIIQVLRFQATRIREVATSHGHSHQES